MRRLDHRVLVKETRAYQHVDRDKEWSHSAKERLPAWSVYLKLWTAYWSIPSGHLGEAIGPCGRQGKQWHASEMLEQDLTNGLPLASESKQETRMWLEVWLEGRVIRLQCKLRA